MKTASFYRFRFATLWIVRCMLLAVGLTWPASGALAYERDEEFYDYFRNWFARVDKTQEAQPHWMTPIVTTTPRLEEELRYDNTFQKQLGGQYLTSYGAQKGLELIPTEETELIISIPTYQEQLLPKKPYEHEGLTDMSFLVKYRFLAANEEHGNYIVTGFLSATAPTGVNAFTTHTSVITPTLAAGKGWGTRREGFDIQSTLGWSIPSSHEKQLGAPIVWNTALQPYGFKYLWPEVEFSYTHWVDGPTTTKNKNQWTITPGLILGRFPVWDRVRAVVGLGYQVPITDFRTQEHTWILTVRFPF